MSSSNEQSNPLKVEVNSLSFVEFLESVSPGTPTAVHDVAVSRHHPAGAHRGYFVSQPEIQLHCPSDSCNGIRFFRSDGGDPEIVVGNFRFFYLSYTCANCRSQKKTYALGVECDETTTPKLAGLGLCYKFGEFPPYGPPTPARLITMIGPDRELFLKGRRCENQGLGIGAFVYYRRVVENQKSRILEQIIKVAETVGTPADDVDVLQKAQREVQFSKAVASVKDAIPRVLLINGHNPLVLLHSALSEGVHDMTDEECLQLANSIRVVLGELSEKLSEALKDEVELKQAISRLVSRRPGRQLG